MKKYSDSYYSNRSFLSKLFSYLSMQIKIKLLHIPTRMIIYITDRCNARCEHCFYWKELNKKNEPSLLEFQLLTDSLPYLDTISITGGEPFIRKDIFDIIKIFSRKTKKIAISTNGSFTEFICETISRVLKELDIYISLQISLDGVGEIHDKIRGVKIFDKVVNTLLKLKEVKNDRFSFNTLTVITNNNYKEIDRIADFVQNKLNVNAFFEFVRGERKDKSVVLPPINEIPDLLEKIKKIYSKNVKDPLLLYIDYKMLEAENFVIKNNRPLYRCYAGSGTGVIYPNGDISVCELFPPFDNLKRYNWNFKRAWFSKIAKLERKKVVNCFCTHGCWMFQNVLLSPKAMLKYFIDKS